MADEEIESPRPFRRERNLSNRNFAKRRSNRRISVESHSSVESFSAATESGSGSGAGASNNSHVGRQHNGSATLAASAIASSGSSGSLSLSSVSSALQLSYSVNSDTESAFQRNSRRKMMPPPLPVTSPPYDDEADAGGTSNAVQPEDPALLGVRQKVHRFETLTTEQRLLFKAGRYQSKSPQTPPAPAMGEPSAMQPGLWRVFPATFKGHVAGSAVDVAARDERSSSRQSTSASSFHTSIDEERSVDDVDDFSDYAEEDEDAAAKAAAAATAEEYAGHAANEYIVPEEAHELREDVVPSPLPGYTPHDVDQQVNANAVELSIDDFGKVESVRSPLSGEYAEAILNNVADEEFQQQQQQQQQTTDDSSTSDRKKANKDFPRNYRSAPRPKTEIYGTKNQAIIDKCVSLYQPRADEAEEEVQAELRDKSSKHIRPILEELIKTEETYVENLKIGLVNYGNIFQRKDLPVGLRGKKYVLLGNIGQICEFHCDEFLPMLQRNRRDLKRLFDEFQHYIDQNFFYCYVIFTMNKQRSLRLCETYKNYFKRIQNELDDKLGINSFLVQPIQRMARYPLLLQQFISTLFKHRDFEIKPLLESCCRLEKKMRTLLTTTNESEVINDIVDCNEFNVFHQGKFRKVSDFNVFDHTLKRSYRAKVFIFDKCIIYTEIKGKTLIFHGRYPCEHIGILAKPKYFTLFYERRKQQECDFAGEPALIEMWLELIRDMINSYVSEERLKLQERYSRENDHLHRKPPNLSLYRDSNRFSSDSGIGNIWVMPKPEAEQETASNRTTWYAIN